MFLHSLNCCPDSSRYERDPLFLLPYGRSADRPYSLPQFQCDYDGVCQRSDDGGGTWQALDTGGVRLDRLVAYALSPHLAEDGTIYFLTQADLYRYVQGSRAWSRCTLPAFGDRDYTRYLTSLATAETGEGQHALFVGSYAGELLRFAATDLTWQDVGAGLMRPSPVATRPEGSAPSGQGSVPALPPTPVSLPTPCTSPIDERLQTGYAGLPPRLGCAAEAGVGTLIAYQPFERGEMFWRQDTRAIYVLSQDGTWATGTWATGTWATYEDTWYEGQPDADPALVPPQGLSQPVHGFGKVWREQLGGASAAIGWATRPETALDAVIQAFNDGLLLKGEAGALYVLYDDGTWETIKRPKRP
jgi:hypothetical protein